MEKRIKIHPQGKIDVHERKAKLDRAVDRLEKNQSIIPENKSLILAFLRDCALGKTVIGRSKKSIGVARCEKYLGILLQLTRAFEKSFHQVTQDDMEEFIQNLEDNQVTSCSGKPYSEATKGDIKKAIKKFWKWKDGKNRSYPELVEWIDTYVPVKEIPAITKPEVEKMIENSSNPRDKALIIVLFDSGARAEEILNVRLKKEHLYWKDEVGCFMIRLEFSKTKPRTISLPLSTKFLREWLEVHPAKDNTEAQLFPMTYPAMKMIVYRLGKRVLGKRVTPHMLRHSSATYYANRLKNQFKMCYRYGWTMASKEVNRYLDREGIMENETVEAVKSDEIFCINRENKRLQEELAILKESHSELEIRFEKMSEELKELKAGKGLLSLLLKALEKEREAKSEMNEVNGKESICSYRDQKR